MRRMRYFAGILAASLLLGGGILSFGHANAAGETCAFTGPSFNVVNGLPFAEVSNETTVPDTATAANLPTVSVPFTLQWTATANGTPLQASDGYVAVLSSSDTTDSANQISGQLVSLNGSYQAAFSASGLGLVTKYATYTLAIQKNGAMLANCKIRVQGDAITRTSANPHRPTSYSQPLFSGGTYSLKLGGANTTAQYSYSLPVPLFGDHDTRQYGPIDWDFDPQLGQFHKGIYFFPHESPGPAGMFDITDPMNPKPSNLVEWSYSSSFDMHGPLAAGNWPHDIQFHGTDAVEDESGGARFYSFMGSPSDAQVITQFQGGSGSIGDMIDESETNVRLNGGYGFVDPTREWPTAHGGSVTAMAAPQEGKFFLYMAASAGNVRVFDVSDLPGSVNPPNYKGTTSNQAPPNLKSAGSVAWTNVSELQVIPSPDKSKYFLFGRVPGAIPNPSCANGSTPGLNGVCPGSTYIYHPEKAPTIKIGEINPNTGKLSRQKSVTITGITQKEYPPMVNSLMYSPPMSNIQWALVNGAIYVFAVDDLQLDLSASFSGYPVPKTLIIGIYKFDPANLTLTRKSQVTIPNVTGDPLAAEAPVVNPTRYSVIGAEDGKSYPIIVVPNNPPNSQASQAVRRYVNDAAELQFFGTKPFFASASVTATAPDFVLKSKGQHAKAGEEVIRGVPYLGFIRTESGKPNLYLFRNVFQATYDAQSSSIGFTGNPNADIVPYDVRYGGGLRVDKIDVTALGSGSSAPATASGKLTFVKTLFNYDGCPLSCGAQGDQALGDVIVWGKNGNKFAFSGEYGGSFSGGVTGPVTQPLDTATSFFGGGLWVSNEDGSNIQERDLTDTGHIGGTPHHGIRQNLGVLHYDWSSNAGFVADNSVSAPFLPWPDNALSTSHDTTRSVYYTEGASGVTVRSVSPVPENYYWSTNPTKIFHPSLVLKNRAALNSTEELYSLPAWKDVGPIDKSILQGNISSFGDNVLAENVNATNNGYEWKFYSIDADGNASPITGNIIDSGYSGQIVTVLDQSVYPPKLAVLEYQRTAGLVTNGSAQGVPSGQYSDHDAKVKVFKLSSNGGVALDKTIDIPGELHFGYPIRGFGVWGNYVVLPHKNVDTTGHDSLELYTNGTKVDEAALPAGMVQLTGGTSIAISKGGYVAVTAAPGGSGSARNALAYLFKINGSLASSNPSGNPGGGLPGGGTPVTTPPPPQTNNQCIQTYRNLCDQVQQLQKQLCKLVPSLSFCSGGGGGGGAGDGNPIQSAF